MPTINLNGQWTLKQSGNEEAIRATVPGTVHLDLLNAGRISDPYYRDNEESLKWIAAVRQKYKSGRIWNYFELYRFCRYYPRGAPGYQGSYQYPCEN